MRTIFFQSVAALLAAQLVLSAAGAQAGDYGFLPDGGRSVTYRYEAATTGFAGNASTGLLITLTRLGADEVVITVRSQRGPEISSTAMVMGDGSLQALPQRVAEGALSSPSPGASPTHKPARTPRSRVATFVPLPEPSAGATPAPSVFPQALTEVASLLVAAGASGDFPRTWIFEPSQLAGPMTLSLSRVDSGQESTFVADGNGLGNLVHVECVVRSGTFALARGTTKVITSDMDQNQTSTTVWTLSR